MFLEDRVLVRLSLEGVGEGVLGRSWTAENVANSNADYICVDWLISVK